jgi:hypothetical protein
MLGLALLWLLAVAATLVGLRYGLPPKEGPVTATMWWFPFAFMLYLVLPGRELTGLLLVALQFPILAGVMTWTWRRHSLKRVALVAAVVYLAAVGVCAVLVKLFGIGSR